MLYYPQLTSGAVCQLPVSVRTSIRTICNELPGGCMIRIGDGAESLIRWQLQYSNLTDGEWSSIEELFEAAEGRLATFTFLDPTNNLLSWSEDWSKPIWAGDPMLQILQGAQDPFGGNNAVQLTNTSQTTQRIIQQIAGASWFRYCHSLYLRSDTPTVVGLVVSATGEELVASFTTGPNWTRFVQPTDLSVRTDGVGFGIQLPAGARIQVFGAQVEAQEAPGAYKKTVDRCGVYAKTRFDSDALRISASAPGQYSSVVTLVSRLS